MKAKRERLFLLTAVGVLNGWLAIHLSALLPPPTVSLRFEGFTARGTNVYAVVGLTNHGPKLFGGIAAFTGSQRSKLLPGG
jgi:hypothetical protein